MYDVARLAGVSHQTVSRVLNDFAGIRPETRDRVLAAIAELGYRPNKAARALVTQRSRAIGVLVPATTDFGPTSSLHAIERAVRLAGYQPLVTTTSLDADAVAESLEFLLGHSIEALVAIAPYRVLLDPLADLDDGLSVVTLQTGDAGGASAGIDQVAGARAAVQHLVDLGHRTIQQLAGPDGFLEAELRRRTVEAEIARHGLTALPTLTGDWSADSGYAAGALVDPAATAVVCGNDQMALGLIHALVDAGRRVPAEVSVVGFDDIPESAHSLPPLTTVHQDFEEVGRRAVALLVHRLDGGDAPPHDLIVPSLTVRASTTRV